jgi:hypothetical protein
MMEFINSGAVMSALNASEAVSKLYDAGMFDTEVIDVMDSLAVYFLSEINPTRKKEAGTPASFYVRLTVAQSKWFKSTR